MVVIKGPPLHSKNIINLFYIFQTPFSTTTLTLPSFSSTPSPLLPLALNITNRPPWPQTNRAVTLSLADLITKIKFCLNRGGFWRGRSGRTVRTLRAVGRCRGRELNEGRSTSSYFRGYVHKASPELLVLHAAALSWIG
jgi:hypothetical protein